MLLQRACGLVQQCRYQYAVRQWAASLLFIFHFDGFPGCEILLKSAGVEPKVQQLRQKSNLPGSIRKREFGMQPSPGLKAV